MPQKANTPITCQVCGATKLVTPQHAERQKFCSATCQGQDRRGKFFGTRATANRVCQICDRPFHAKKVHVTAGIAKFCSNGCRGASQQIPLKIPALVEDLIYLAGIVDGEGTITLMSSSFVPRILVANSHAGLMQWLHATYGGSLYNPRATRKPNHKPIITWGVGVVQAITLCRLLHPYLKIKRRQAEIVIAWGTANSEQRLGLFSELRTLNKRGL